MSDLHFQSVVPADEELQKLFIDKINFIIKRKNDEAAAKSDISATLTLLAETYAENFDKGDQAGAKKFAKAECTLIVNEFMKGVLDDELNKLASAEYSYKKIQKKLKDI